MRGTLPAASALLLLVAFACGCRQYPGGQPAQLTQMQQQYTAQMTELQRRAASLDANNVDMHQRLAQSEQHVRVLQQNLDLVRKELTDTSSRLAKAEAAKGQAEQRLAMLETTTRQRGGAMITANSSLRQEIEALKIPGVAMRYENNTAKIELPADSLFVPGTANLLPGAYTLLDQVAAGVKAHYPSEAISIEGHTDSDPVFGAFGNNDQLSAAQANAVFQILTVRHQLPPGRFQVFGRGAHQPITSNGTDAGKARNRRVELVVQQ